jgi:hypothetical protein
MITKYIGVPLARLLKYILDSPERLRNADMMKEFRKCLAAGERWAVEQDKHDRGC